MRWPRLRLVAPFSDTRPGRTCTGEPSTLSRLATCAPWLMAACFPFLHARITQFDAATAARQARLCFLSVGVCASSCRKVEIYAVDISTMRSRGGGGVGCWSRRRIGRPHRRWRTRSSTTPVVAGGRTAGQGTPSNLPTASPPSSMRLAQAGFVGEAGGGRGPASLAGVPFFGCSIFFPFFHFLR